MKNFKKVTFGLLAAAILAMPLSVSAATDTSAPVVGQTAKYEVNSSLWQSLPSGQQDTLRGLFTQKANIDSSIIEHYKSYGLISEERALSMIEKIGQMTSQTPRMPFIGKNHKGK